MLDLLVLYDLLSTSASEEPVPAVTCYLSEWEIQPQGRLGILVRCQDVHCGVQKYSLKPLLGGRVEAFISHGLSVRVNPSLETLSTGDKHQCYQCKCEAGLPRGWAIKLENMMDTSPLQYSSYDDGANVHMWQVRQERAYVPQKL